MLMRVYFENGKHAELTQEELTRHINIQNIYNNIYEKRDMYAEQLKEKMKNSNIDITEKCINEYQMYCKTLEPQLDMCLKYEILSLLPSLNIKITKFEKVE